MSVRFLLMEISVQMTKQLINRDLDFLQFRLLACPLDEFLFDLGGFQAEDLTGVFNLPLFCFQGRLQRPDALRDD